MVAAGRMSRNNFAVSLADLLPVGDVGDEYARAHDVFHAGSGLPQGSFDVLQRLHGLRVGSPTPTILPSVQSPWFPTT